RVNVTSGWRGFTRTATNRVTSSGGGSDVRVRISSVFENRVASVTTNRLEDSRLEAAVRQAEALARLAPENPEYLPELGAQEYQSVEGYYDTTGDLDPAARAEAAALAVRKAQTAGFVAAGYIDVRPDYSPAFVTKQRRRRAGKACQGGRRSRTRAVRRGGRPSVTQPARMISPLQ
ncbi:MAG: hypothetical protein ACE5JX_14465, partial [Acidobacteriota bacterium]